MSGAVVIGIGNPYRRDDGVGHAAAEGLVELLPGIDVIPLDGEPTRLVDAWANRSLAIVIDAVRGGDAPGTLHRVEVGIDPFPAATRQASTHGAGIEAAVELAGALDMTPDKLIVYGIEPADVSAGSGLSPAVADALPALVGLVAREVRAVSA